jgi:hypothetical protein
MDVYVCEFDSIAPDFAKFIFIAEHFSYIPWKSFRQHFSRGSQASGRRRGGQ